MAKLWCLRSVAAMAASAVLLAGEGGLRIPLREGLTIVTALNQPGFGDFESIKVFTQVNDKVARLKYSAEVPDNGVRHVRATRTIARQDLTTAHEYRRHFHDNANENFPGSTAVGVSAAVLSELKTKGQTQLKVPAGGLADALGPLNALIGDLIGGTSGKGDDVTMLTGTLKQVEPSAVPFKLLVNDRAVELPAIHARGRLDDDEAEFWFLDDPDNPLSLKWVIGDDRLQVIRLSYPAATTTAGATPSAATPATPSIERDLESTGRSIVYGIYFDFSSDRIKEESEPVLKEIADAMTKNPSWKLNVEGHTDAIGGATSNLDLSRRRAASVKQALIARYRIAADRLAPAGFGASRPKETNDTLEGRARNRRVELVRQ